MKYIYKVTLIIIFLFISPLKPALLSQNTKLSIAILKLDGHGISDYEAATLTDRLRSELFKLNGFRVLEREKMDEILKEQGFQQSGCTSSECLVEVGQLVNVNRILGGSIGKVGGTYTVSVRLIDVEKGEIVKTATRDMQGKIDALLTTTIPQIAKDISGQKYSKLQIPDNNVGTNNMVYVEGGTFMMGSNKDNDEKPIHKVYVKDFYMDKYEVTTAQFCQFLNEKGNQTEDGREWLDIKSQYCKIVKQGSKYMPVSGYDNHPVIMVSWYGANAYADWTVKRLPTEAEWEYAARGGNKSKGYEYSGTNNVVNVAWYDYNSGSKTHVVGTRQPNELGLYDMSGNVWEWCADWYDSDYYSKSPYENPNGPASGSSRVLRGGSWGSGAYTPYSTNRYSSLPHNRRNSIGFRCVR